MCPDRELLSAFADGEVPSPWDAKIERHAADCPRCREALDGLRRLRAAFYEGAPSGAEGRVEEGRVAERRGAERRNFEEARLELARGRVLSRVNETLAARGPARPSLWSRRVSLPLPAAAAAALAAGLLAMAWATTGARNAELRMALNAAPQPAPAIASTGMESILELIARQEAGVNITISLPAGASVRPSGEPIMIREADFRPGSGQ